MIYRWIIRMFQKRLGKDKDKKNSMFYAWQSNMAICFKDRYHEKMRNRNLPLDNEDIHEVANNAAKDFLNLLISEKA